MYRSFKFLNCAQFFLAWILAFSVLNVSAEGTKEIRPASTDQGFVVLDHSWSYFALYNCAPERRLNIKICNVGEKIYFGFQQADHDVQFRIKDPSGTIVFGPMTIPTSGAGFINSYAEAVAGPSALAAGGYNALSYTPLVTGDYFIEFVDKNARRDFEYFDITVASAANAAIKGRVWSKSWMLSARSYNNKFKGKAFIYADDGIVTSIDFNGMQPFVFVLSANSDGCINTGNPFTDRQSRKGLQNYPQYKIFLNDPDINCFPTGSFGNLTGPITISGCDPNNRCINIPVDKAGNANVILDLNGTAGYQPNTSDRIISATLIAGNNCIAWNSKDGLGAFVASGTNIPIQLDYFNGITHMPLFDVEYNPNGYIVALVRPAGTAPKLFWDDVNIPGGTTNLTGCNSPCHTWVWNASQTDNAATDYGNNNTINTWWYANILNATATYNVNTIVVDANRMNPPLAANDTTVCSTVTSIPLRGLVTGATGGVWSGGAGTYSPSTAGLTGTYTPTAAERASAMIKLTLTSTGNGICPSVFDTLRIFFTPAPTSNAGPNQSVCANNPVVNLTGTKTNATGASWVGGTGTFFPDRNTLSITYTPSAAEISAGTATLTLTTSGSGVCNPASSNSVVTITAKPVVTIAGGDQIKCKNNPVVTLNGSVTVATGGTWTKTGTGTFANANALNTTYTPSAADLTAGSVKLTLTSTGNGNCHSENSSITVTFTNSPTINAGGNQSVCTNNSVVTLAGSVGVSTGGAWSGGSGVFANPANLNTTYTPSAAELAAATPLTLTLTSTGNGTCNAVTSTMQVSFTPKPTISAGSDASVCANNPAVTLAGVVTVATGGTWSNGSGSYVPGITTLNATYTPSATEINNGLAVLILTSTGNGTCNAVKDTVLITILPAPNPNAGADKTVCRNNPAVSLSTASAPGATGRSWSSTGSGSFSPNANVLNPTYNPSVADINSAGVTLTLTATRAPSCSAVTDQMIVTFSNSPTANAGADQTVCSNNAIVSVNGAVTGATGGTWSTLGTGTFALASNLTTTYTPSPADTTAGSVKLVLTTTGNGTCSAVTDTMKVTFSTSPKANAGSAQTVCANNVSVTLNGAVARATGGTWSGGSGIFNPGNTSLNATYTPSAAEITAGSVTLTLTSSGGGTCNAVTSTTTITITPKPVVNAGTDKSVCANNPAAALSGTVTVGTGGIWSGGTGTYSPNASTLVTTYTPSASEILAGTVTLTLTSTTNGICNAESNDVIITITPAPSVDAGSDQILCAATASATLNGAVTVSTGGTWTTGGTGTFSNANALNATYTPSAADKTAGFVIHTLATTGNGTCTAISDQMRITFTTIPAISAGPDQTICSNDFPVLLSATGTPATWVGGSGTFAPGRTVLNPSYTPSAAELAAGTVTLTITTNAAGACPSVSDNIILTLVNSPSANAGANQTICGNLNTVTLAGSVSNAGGGTWTSNGTGTFSPNANALNATYNPSAADKAAGSITLTLTTTGNGSCAPAASSMTVTFTPVISVNAGPDQIFCSDVNTINLSGIFSNAGGVQWSGGTGSFASSTSAVTTYNLTAGDKTGPLTLTLTTTSNGGCAAQSDNVSFTFTTAPTASAGSNQTICGDVSSVTLTGTINAVPTGATWTTTGSGTFSPSASTLTTTYFPTATEKTGSVITFTLTTTGNGSCNAVTSSSILTITPKPTVNAGSDQTVCADAAGVNLSGSVTVAGGGTWTSNGTGTFNPNANTLTATYVPSASDITGGTVTLTLTSTANGTCAAVSDQMLINITSAPTANAGADKTVCADVVNIPLAGSVTVSTGGTWSSTGTGSFSPNATTLAASYVPSAADKALASFKIILTTAATGTCQLKKDTLIITVTPKPTVSAGPAQTICGDSSFVSLNGTVTTATGGIWTSNGSGSFFPSPVTLNANYVPSAADITSGSVTLTLTSTGNGICNAVTSSAVITITPAPTASAGADQTVCADLNGVTLNGSKTVAGGITWSSSGTGTFSPNNTTANATYVPSAFDKGAGIVTLTIKTTTNGNCKQVSDQMNIAITPAPTVDAGPDRSICADAAGVSLTGNSTVASGAIWTSNGTGVFLPDATTLNATYDPSTADKTAGTVVLTLTTTGNGLCNAVSDNLTLIITPAPTVSAGPDQTVCAAVTGVTLAGSKTVAGGVKWTSTGTGTFSPNTHALNATYQPSAADTATHSVTLTLTTTANGTCTAVNDQMIINFTPAPVSNAGTAQTVCGNVDFIVLDGKVSNATGGSWSTSGSGFFSPDNVTLNANYVASAADISSGSVVLTLTSTGNGICAAKASTVIITINPIPSANAGADKSVCADVAAVSLNGTVTGATGGLWTTTGSGTFASDVSLSTTYTPSAADVSGGLVRLTLTTTGAGICNNANDDILISFVTAPTVNAGADKSICADTTGLALTGSMSGAGGVTWTGNGAGTFSPSATNLNATYVPAGADLAGGTVTLTLTTTGNGTCTAKSDQMNITIAPVPVVDAGPDQSVCSDVTEVILNGSVNHATGGAWTTASGTGTFNPNANTLNASFVPSAFQITNGRAILTLSSTGNGLCKVVKDAVTITLSPVPTVNAGQDVTVCAGVANVPLNGVFTVATGVTWSTTGGGSFLPNANTANASYVPAAAENVNGGSVTLTLTTTGSGSCNEVFDQVIISFNTQPVSAGNDQTVCTNGFPVQLNGVGNGSWSGGGGVFSPSPNNLNATYVPTAGEVTAGFVDLTLTGAAVGSCLAGSDVMRITIKNGPVVDAGLNQTVCGNKAAITLAGTVTNATGRQWSTDGSGTFSPSATSAAATYNPSSSDISNGSVNLTLTSTGNGTCSAAADTVKMFFTPAPTITAGGDQTVCADGSPINLNGAVTIATGADWTSTGSGSFGSTTNPVTTYTPSAADMTAAGGITLTLTSSGNGNCNAVSSTMKLKFSGGPTASAGSNQTVCADVAGVAISGSVTVATGGTWSSNGTGSFSPNASTLTATYLPSAADRALPNVTLTLTTTGNGTCLSASSSMIVTFQAAPTISTGADQTICADVASINVTAATTGAGSAWSTSGSGTFGNATALNTTYTPSPADIIAGGATLTIATTGNGFCNAASSSMVLVITPKPASNAGLDQTLCADVNSVSLNGSVTVATGGTWSIISGTGSFSNANTLSTTYNPSALDKTGTVTLALTTSTGNGTCNPVTDQVQITFTTSPTVSAGPNNTICADSAYAPLSGSVTIAAGGQWTSTGTGIFSPDASVLNASYFPSIADKASLGVTLTLTTTGNGTCNTASNSMILTINPKPTVTGSATPDTVCGSIPPPVVGLVGSKTNAGGVLWNTSGAGTYTPSNTSLIASYNPTAADVAAGAVNLSITTTSNGLCKAVSDFVTITLIPAPTAAVDAGFDQTICADVTAANLNGKIQNAGGGVWSSNGTGTFVPNASTLNATYQLSAADRALASVTLTLTTTGNGPCAAVSDQLVITISSRPSVAAGADQSLCADVNSIAINGTVTVATGGIWTSGGTGTFTPNAATLTASYIPSAQDITAGKVGLTLTSTGNGTCNAKSDDLLITFSAKPTANAGIDQTVCADITSLKITGSVTAATGGTWVSTGSGTFTPNANALIITYTPSAADKNAGRVNLTLSTTGMSNGCNAVQDQMSITLTPTPTVNAGPDKTVCADIGSSALSGSVTVASGGIWTTTGSGVFSLSSSSLAASYAPSQADKALGSVKLILTSSGNGTCNAVKDTMIMTILPKPVVTVGSVSNCVFTSGAALSGVVTNASGGQWSTSGSGLFSPNEFALNASYFPSAADIASGKATLTLTSTGNGTCNPVSASTNVIISPLPLANAGSDQFVCRNGSTVLSAQTSSNVTYLWKTLSGTSIVASQFANVTITKDTNFVLTVTDKKGCFSSDTIAVQAIDQPSFGLPAQHCLTDSTVLHALVSGSYPNGIYTWYKSNILIPNQNDSTLKVRSSGTYSVIYTVGSCATSPKSTVVTDPLLLITNRKQVVCTGSTVSLATTTVPSAPAGTTFDWKLSNTSIANSNPSSISALVDTNVYKVTVTDNLGCISYDSIKVIGIPKPDPMLKDSTTCAGGNIPLNGKPANISNVDSLFPAYQWTKNGTSLSTDSSIIVNASGRYIVSITIGSCSNQDTSDINFNPVPSRINPNMMGFCSETDSVILNAGNPGARYLWSVPTADTTRFITVSSAGIYHVKITNSFLCSIDDSVTVKDVCPPRLFMPEGFWPVGDPSLADTTTGRGKDAFFGIFGAHISNENFDLSVFNRWGELIFHTTDKNETWDGKYKGDLIPTGVYPWTVKYQGDSEEFKGPYKLEGRVVLFR